MEELTRIALAGTAKHAAAGAPDAEHAAEALVAAMKADDREAVFLLRAGVRSVFHQCGCLPLADASPAEPSLAETRPFASQRLVGLLENAMAAESHDLLVEFLRQLEATDLLMPPELLPQALGIREATIRERLLPVLGERGRWLGRLNPDWRWASAGAADLSGRDREALARQWDEGNIRERCGVLRRLRRADPAEARRWIEAAIDKEKPEHRVALLETLEVGLGTDDEALLESRLDDRSEQVRSAAAGLLARLAGSALARRMRERAEAILSPASAGWIRKRLRLSCHPPEEIDKSWTRDGIPAKAPPGRGKRAVWTEAVLAVVPPSLWSERFGASPSQLIEALADDEFGSSVLVGWTRAAAVMAAADPASAAWLRPLWDHWAKAAGQGRGKKLSETTEYLQLLLHAMSGEEAEASLMPMLAEAAGSDSADVLSLLVGLPRPWSAAFGQKYLGAIRAVVSRRADNVAYQWANTLFTAGRALPRDMLDAAILPWKVAEGGADQWHNQAVGREIDKFTETIHTRQSFYEEALRRS